MLRLESVGKHPFPLCSTSTREKMYKVFEFCCETCAYVSRTTLGRISSFLFMMKHPTSASGRIHAGTLGGRSRAKLRNVFQPCVFLERHHTYRTTKSEGGRSFSVTCTKESLKNLCGSFAEIILANPTTVESRITVNHGLGYNSTP